MKINLPVFKDEDTKDAITRFGAGTKLCIFELGIEITPFSLMPSACYKVTQGSS